MMLIATKSRVNRAYEVAIAIDKNKYAAIAVPQSHPSIGVYNNKQYHTKKKAVFFPIYDAILIKYKKEKNKVIYKAEFKKNHHILLLYKGSSLLFDTKDVKIIKGLSGILYDILVIQTSLPSIKCFNRRTNKTVEIKLKPLLKSTGLESVVENPSKDLIEPVSNNPYI